MEEGSQSVTVKHRGCSIEQTVMKTLHEDLDDSSPSAPPVRNRRGSSTMVQEVPIREVVPGWIDPAAAERGAGPCDRIRQKHPADDHQKTVLTMGPWSGDDGSSDYNAVMKQVRAIEAAVNHDKKLVELKNMVAELKLELKHHKVEFENHKKELERIKQQQQQHKGPKLIGTVIGAALPVPDSIRSKLHHLRNLLNLVVDD